MHKKEIEQLIKDRNKTSHLLIITNENIKMYTQSINTWNNSKFTDAIKNDKLIKLNTSLHTHIAIQKELCAHLQEIESELDKLSSTWRNDYYDLIK